MIAVPMWMALGTAVRRRRADVPHGSIRTTLPALCRRAGVRLRATAPARTLYVYRGAPQLQIRTADFDLIAVPCSARSREGALRALEALAHSFFDHAARACVCRRGLFRAPTHEELEIQRQPATGS